MPIPTPPSTGKPKPSTRSWSSGIHKNAYAKAGWVGFELSGQLQSSFDLHELWVEILEDVKLGCISRIVQRRRHGLRTDSNSPGTSERNELDLIVRVRAGESLDSSEKEEENGTFRPQTFADWRDLPGDALDREDLRKAIRDAVGKLPEKYRAVFVLADGQSLAYAEIAEILNLTVSNVKTRLHRARMMLQEHLTPAFTPRMSDHIALLKGMNPWSRARR